MAGQMMSGGGGGGRRRRRGRYTPMSEINVTPFVDVMLVLLIVFMVTAPLLTVGVPVDLPQANAQAITTPEEPLVVSVDSDGRIYVQETEVTPVSLVPFLRDITDANPETRIYVRGDRVIPYGFVMEVMGLINEAGFRRVALLAEQPTGDLN
ncbi:MAG: protein TolR [Pseudomonadota bacterium]